MARHPDGKILSRTDRHRHWRAHVDAQASSPLSQRAYCNDHDLAYSSFTYWRRRLRGSGTRAAAGPSAAASAQPTPACGFVPVTLDPVSANTMPAVPVTLAVVLPGGLRIEGVDVANIGTVAALVAVL